MLYCNATAILNKALSKVQDDSDEFRLLALGWLNEIVRDVLNQPREWAFLNDTVDLAVTANQITLPNGVSEIVHIDLGGTFYLPADMLTDPEAALDRTGYTINKANIVTFYPDTTEVSATVKYKPYVTADLADVATDTIFPIEFENLFLTGVRVHIYDYDKDGRYGKEEQKYAMAMSNIKTLDNRRKPELRNNPHGYTRGNDAKLA